MRSALFLLSASLLLSLGPVSAQEAKPGSWKELKLFEHADSVWQVRFTPKGVLTGCRDGSVRLWSLEGKLLTSFGGHRGTARFALIPGGSEIVTIGTKGKVSVWPAGGAEKPRASTERHGWLNRVACSAKGGVFAVAGRYSRGLLLGSLSDAKLERIGGKEDVWHVAFSPDGSLLAASGDEAIALYRMADRSLVAKLPGRMSHLAFDPGGRFLLAGGEGEIPTLWAPDGKPTARLGAVNLATTSVAVHPEGWLVATGHLRGEVRLWSAPQGLLLATLAGYTDRVRTLAFSPDGSTRRRRATS